MTSLVTQKIDKYCIITLHFAILHGYMGVGYSPLYYKLMSEWHINLISSLVVAEINPYSVLNYNFQWRCNILVGIFKPKMVLCGHLRIPFFPQTLLYFMIQQHLVGFPSLEGHSEFNRHVLALGQLWNYCTHWSTVSLIKMSSE